MWIYLYSLIGLILIGGLVMFIELNTLKSKIDYCEDFIDHYSKYCQSLYAKDEIVEEYQWLIANSGRMQRSLGSYGILSSYIDGRFQYTNLQVITNLIPAIKSAFREIMKYTAMSFDYERMEEVISIVGNCLLRYHGDITEEIRLKRRATINPLIMLREGIQWIVTFPIKLIYWSGIIEYSWYSKLTNNYIIKFINAVIILLGLTSSVITITTGYNPFVEYLQKYGVLD